jgi:purine-binding chemotaxis protein CheW
MGAKSSKSARVASPAPASPGTPESAAESPREAQSDICQFVTFVVGEEVFAVDLAPVQEIIRVPEVVAVPMSPSSLDGLANLRGKILPIISLRRIFGFEERPYDDSTRAVVIDLGQPLGFVVDRVASVVSVDRGHIESPGAIKSTVDTDLLSGLLKDVGGHKMIMVLDFGRLIASEFVEVPKAAAGDTARPLASERTADATPAAQSAELQFVSFEVARQEYAIVIEDVQEIVQIPKDIVHVPHAKSHVLGVMTLRNRLLPLVSLRRMFGLADRDSHEESRIVVVSHGGIAVGVVMDSVNQVLRVARSAVDRMPGLLAQDGSMSDIEEICRLDGGKRMVSIISVKNMFRNSAMQAAINTVDAMTLEHDADAAKSSADAAGDDEEQVVVFRLGKEEFAVPIESVQEIVRLPDEMTKVPKAASAVEGVINLRGAVLPVIDLRRRLGLAAVERSDRQRIVVLVIEGVRTGFIVDSVAEVLKVPRSAIEPAPRLTGDPNQVLARMANLEKQKRMVQLIDPLHLIERQDRADLAELAA